MRAELALRHGTFIAGGRGRGSAFGRAIQEEKLAPQRGHQERLAKSTTPIPSQNDNTSDYPSLQDDWLQRHRVKRRHQNTCVIIPMSTKNPGTELFPTVFQADRNVPLDATTMQ